jgi:hypothetical protein
VTASISVAGGWVVEVLDVVELVTDVEVLEVVEVEVPGSALSSSPEHAPTRSSTASARPLIARLIS